MDEKVDLLLFMGQSNMQGQSHDFDSFEANNLSFEYKYLSDEIKQLGYPLGENILNNLSKGKDLLESDLLDSDSISKWLSEHALGASVGNCYNILPPFLKRYTELTKRKTIVCHMAKGSTSISNWLKGTDTYNVVINKSKAAINKIGLHNINKIFVIWLQGESDAVAGTKTEDYLQSLKQLKNDIKNEINIFKFTLIKVGPFTLDEKDLLIALAQEKAVIDDSDFVFLTKETCELLKHPEEYTYYPGHYNKKAFDIIGKLAAETLAKIC